MRKLVFVLLAFVTMIGLSACGGTTEKTYQPTTQNTVQQEAPEPTVDDKLYVGSQKLPDGRTVVCVAFNGQALSCDWGTAQR